MGVESSSLGDTGLILYGSEQDGDFELTRAVGVNWELDALYPT